VVDCAAGEALIRGRKVPVGDSVWATPVKDNDRMARKDNLADCTLYIMNQFP